MQCLAVSLVICLCVLSGINIKECTGENLKRPINLCSFKKSKHTCACKFKTDPHINFPVLIADCTRMNIQQFPRNNEISEVEDLDISHNFISTLDSYKNNFQSLKIRSIKLSFNKITTISQDFFKNTPNLLDLDLSNNEIVNFPNSNVFRGLNKLKILNLSFNKLPTLPEGIFSPLPNLKELDLRHNYFGELLMTSKNLFKSPIELTPNITILKLDGLRINNLHYTYFDGASYMKYLSLSNNPLEEIPAVPYTIDYLDLSGTHITTLSARYLNYHSLKILKLNRLNKLEKIEHYAFYNLQALEELHLSDCRNLKEFNELAFGVMENTVDFSLKKIFLARSGLKSFNSTYRRLLNKVEHVDLQSNPWYCDCNILWLQEFNGTLYRDGNLRCFTPLYLANKKIMELTGKDMPGCVQTDNHHQRILISILGALVAILMILIVYLMYLGPFYHKNKYRGIGPESPYHGNTIGIIPTRAERFD